MESQYPKILNVPMAVSGTWYPFTIPAGAELFRFKMEEINTAFDYKYESDGAFYTVNPNAEDGFGNMSFATDLVIYVRFVDALKSDLTLQVKYRW